VERRAEMSPQIWQNALSGGQRAVSFGGTGPRTAQERSGRKEKNLHNWKLKSPGTEPDTLETYKYNIIINIIWYNNKYNV
jgi:hypothetical protein